MPHLERHVTLAEQRLDTGTTIKNTDTKQDTTMNTPKT